MKNNKISFSICQLDTQTILNHLKKCDNLFSPKLSSTVDLIEYSEKISKNAIHFCCFSDNNLIGLHAMYLNNFDDKIAYGTIVAVVDEFQGKGIGKKLFDISIVYAKEKGFVAIRGEARKDKPIRKFYYPMGFKIIEERKETFLLELSLK